jgi:hypothetical protein
LPETKNTFRACLLTALAATALMASWQALTVRYTYGGNWTGLFCAGSRFDSSWLPLKENIYRFPNSVGYDGQFYHLVAHDPFLRRGFASAIDDPRYRYGRILVPALAYVLALGHDPAVDAAYIGLILLSVFAGCYWMGRYAILRGYPAWSGLLFAAAPAALISIDRLTVDVALAACCAGFALYATEGANGKLYVLLAAAGLTRETGVLLIAAWCLWLASDRHWRRAAIFATAAIPTACWLLFVYLHTPPHTFETVSLLLFRGIVCRFLHPSPYPPGVVGILATALDYLALIGVAATLFWAIGRAWVRARSPLAFALFLFAALAIALSTPLAWAEVYGFGRALTPLLLMATVDGMSVDTIAPAIFMLLLDPRIGVQMGGQILNVVHGVFR